MAELGLGEVGGTGVADTDVELLILVAGVMAGAVRMELTALAFGGRAILCSCERPCGDTTALEFIDFRVVVFMVIRDVTLLAGVFFLERSMMLEINYEQSVTFLWHTCTLTRKFVPFSNWCPLS